MVRDEMIAVAALQKHKGFREHRTRGVQRRCPPTLRALGQIWQNYTQGETSLDEARAAILRTAAPDGIPAPEWFRVRHPRGDEAARVAVDARELPYLGGDEGTAGARGGVHAATGPALTNGDPYE